MILFPFSDYGAHRGKENADAVEADMGLQTAAAIKFCFKKLVRADVRRRKCVDPALLAETPVKRRRYGCCFTSAFGRFCCEIGKQSVFVAAIMAMPAIQPGVAS